MTKFEPYFFPPHEEIVGLHCLAEARVSIFWRIDPRIPHLATVLQEDRVSVNHPCHPLRRHWRRAGPTGEKDDDGDQQKGHRCHSQMILSSFSIVLNSGSPV